MSVGPSRHSKPPLETGPVDAARHIAVTPHHLATRAAVRIMEAGGNAVDGAIAANAVLGVVAPDTCGPGGDLFALIHHDGHAVPRALNASGRAGSGADAARMRGRGVDGIPPRSPWTITVPGCVDGWEALLADEGSMSMAEVLDPAIGIATEGFTVSAELAGSLARLRDALAGQASARPLYPDGRLPKPGDILRRVRFAATLSAIARDGRDAFYCGDVGAAITDVTSGMISGRDLRRRQAEWVTPLSLDVLGATAWTVPPNSQGYVTLAAAWIFERFTEASEPRDPEYQHGLIEAYRAVAWDLEDLAADPAATQIDPATLLASEQLARRLDVLSTGEAVRWPSPRAGRGGTAFMCARDGRGTGVALIQSNYHGIGTGLSAADTGVFLHDRGAGFNLIEGHPNELQPGKRPLHTLSPTIWTRGTRLVSILGTRGGTHQPQLLLQVASNLFRASMTASSAVQAPRWGLEETRFGDGYDVVLERDHDPAMIEALAAKGHPTRLARRSRPGWGPVSVINSLGSGFEGVADPRVGTTAAFASA